MTPTTLAEQLTKYLTDAHCIEQQALIQMKAAPRLAGDRSVAAVFSEHETETQDHERLIAERLRARGARPSRVKDAAGLVTGVGFAAFAALQPDTPGKLVVHALSYEHMEEAAYNLLGRVAEREGDTETVAVAGRIEAQERDMGDRVADCFDRAAEASLRRVTPDGLREQLTKYLTDAHAIEGQALQLLAAGRKIAGSEEPARAYDEHRRETEEHQRLVTERLRAVGGAPNRLKDAALQMGALNWGAFFAGQPDTPAKLIAFAYAFEHLEIGAYEMLRRVADRAGDAETVQVAEWILAQEKAAADRLHGLFGDALDATLSRRGLAVPATG
ncbi:MAG TPA: DUF892 family protein [Solirubrobacteraceae bacterium]|jgi:ferritin-like metal-binding protein YciE|nr:DUF892 family protein [Solirubrobacteraceae bacterium]